MLVTVYGTLKRGFGNHSVLSNSEFVGEDLVLFSKIESVGFPIVKLGGIKKLKVEVFKINEDVLRNLDMLEGEGYMYRRIEIDTKYGKSYIYEYINDVNDESEMYKVGELYEWK